MNLTLSPRSIRRAMSSGRPSPCYSALVAAFVVALAVLLYFAPQAKLYRASCHIALAGATTRQDYNDLEQAFWTWWDQQGASLESQIDSETSSEPSPKMAASIFASRTGVLSLRLDAIGVDKDICLETVTRTSKAFAESRQSQTASNSANMRDELNSKVIALGNKERTLEEQLDLALRSEVEVISKAAADHASVLTTLALQPPSSTPAATSPQPNPELDRALRLRDEITKKVDELRRSRTEDHPEVIDHRERLAELSKTIARYEVASRNSVEVPVETQENLRRDALSKAIQEWRLKEKQIASDAEITRGRIQKELAELRRARLDLEQQIKAIPETQTFPLGALPPTMAVVKSIWSTTPWSIQIAIAISLGALTGVLVLATGIYAFHYDQFDSPTNVEKVLHAKVKSAFREADHGDSRFTPKLARRAVFLVARGGEAILGIAAGGLLYYAILSNQKPVESSVGFAHKPTASMIR